MATTIQVSDSVKSRLDALKEREEHTSYDSLLRVMLEEYE